MKNKTINRVCCPANLYALLQYLLLSSEEEIENTYFFLDAKFIPQSIATELKNHSFFKFFLFPRWLRIIAFIPYWSFFIIFKNLFVIIYNKNSLTYFYREYFPVSTSF